MAHVAGTYVLDGDAAVRSAHTFVHDVVPVPRYQRHANVHAHDAYPRTMAGTLELRPDGTMVLTRTTDGAPEPTTRGTWRVDGDQVHLTAAAGAGGDGAPQVLAFTRSGDTLTATLAEVAGSRLTLVFVRR